MAFTLKIGLPENILNRGIFAFMMQQKIKLPFLQLYLLKID